MIVDIHWTKWTHPHIGLNREQHGEKLSATRFIQGYAVDRLLELAEFIEPSNEIHRDPFVNERRFEQQFSNLIPQLNTWMQGYKKNRESALAILEFLEGYNVACFNLTFPNVLTSNGSDLRYRTVTSLSGALSCWQGMILHTYLKTSCLELICLLR